MRYQSLETKQQRAEREAHQDLLLARGQKACTRCHQVKPLGDFTAQHVGFGGKEAKCRDCKREEQRPFQRAKRQRRRARIGGSYQTKRKAKPKGAPSRWREALRAFQGDRCPYCQKLLGDDATMEHMDPRTAENHAWDNVILVHRICNSLKGARTVEEWRPELMEEQRHD